MNNSDYIEYKNKVQRQAKRIAELEAENKHLEDYIDAYQKSEAINIAKLDKKDERIKELEAENERLKGELEMEHDDCSNAKKCEVEYHKAYEKELDENVILRNENAKLKCLALHLFSLIGFYASEWYSECDEERQVRRAVKWWKIHIKYNKAYRKAKKELKEKTK